MKSDKLYKRKLIFILIGPALFAAASVFIDISPSNPAAGRTLAVGMVMAFYWITEAIPLAATAMIPVVLFPMLGIMSGKSAASVYFNNIIFLFIGGFIVALAMEKWNLHKRIALKIIIMLRGGRARLMLGFMLSTWALSMWISNTATMMMMVPIVMAIILKLEEKPEENLKGFETALLLGVAYASSIGGMATLIGTPPNLAFVKIYSISFPSAAEVSFVSWFAFALPLSFVFFLVSYLFLKYMFLRGGEHDIDFSMLRREYESLGKPAVEEKAVLAAFLIMAALWITRSDIHIGAHTLRGWSSLLGNPSFVDDGTVAVMTALALFLMPARRRKGFIMDWETAKKLPWGIVLLFGGGFALAKGFHDSGLSGELGDRLQALESLPPIIIVLSICVLVTFLTELTSNTATTQVILPIIAALSARVDISPLLLMVPATISASCAFMLPVATPPNAIIFGTDRIKVSSMARTGFLLNLAGIVLITLCMFLLGSVVLKI